MSTYTDMWQADSCSRQQMAVSAQHTRWQCAALVPAPYGCCRACPPQVKEQRALKALQELEAEADAEWRERERKEKEREKKKR